MSDPILQHRPLREIAGEIRADWSKQGKGVTPYADAYLAPMETLNSINDNFFMDSAKSVVLYFLSNANTYRGENARRLKAELKQIVGVK